MPPIITSDALSKPSREFFERTKMKLAISFIFCITAWLLIGMTAEAGTYLSTCHSHISHAFVYLYICVVYSYICIFSRRTTTTMR